MAQSPKIPNHILEKEYVQNKKSIQEISIEYSVPSTSIRRRLAKLKIPFAYTRPPIKLTKDVLLEEYKTLSVPEIAKKYDISISGIHAKMKKLNIEIKKRTLDITGHIYGNLTVLNLAPKKINRGEAHWECRCICGVIINVSSYGLRNGFIKSCGCHWRTAYEDISGEYLAALRNGAKSRDLQFNITNEEIWQKFINQERKCAISGLSLSFFGERSRSKGGCQTASLDRIDSTKGYTVDNIQWVHKDVNQMKMDLPEDNFFKYVKIIYEHKQLNLYD